MARAGSQTRSTRAHLPLRASPTRVTLTQTETLLQSRGAATAQTSQAPLGADGSIDGCGPSLHWRRDQCAASLLPDDGLSRVEELEDAVDYSTLTGKHQTATVICVQHCRNTGGVAKRKAGNVKDDYLGIHRQRLVKRALQSCAGCEIGFPNQFHHPRGTTVVMCGGQGGGWVASGRFGLPGGGLHPARRFGRMGQYAGRP